MKSFPPLDFMFSQDAQYRWFPEDYFINEELKGQWCIAMEYLGGRLILGGVFMRHYDIYFDKANSKIKFARSKCNGNDHVTTFNHYQNLTAARNRKKHARHLGPPKLNFLARLFFNLLTLLCTCWVLYYCIFVQRYRKDRFESVMLDENGNRIEVTGTSYVVNQVGEGLPGDDFEDSDDGDGDMKEMEEIIDDYDRDVEAGEITNNNIMMD